MTAQDATVIKIDKDLRFSREWLRDWITRVVLPVCASFNLTVIKIVTTSTKHGAHYYIHVFPKVDPWLELELCFLLGDDAKRVSLNRSRLRAGYLNWSKLFEPPNVRMRTIYRLGELLV